VGPLLAIADAAGGTWPDLARVSCVELVQATANTEISLGTRLLSDLRDAFAGVAALSTEIILQELHSMDEAPWGDLKGKPLDPRRLARILSDYEVHSTKVKIAGRSLQGYRREDLHDPWTRYLPPATTSSAPPTPTSSDPEPPELPEPPDPATKTGILNDLPAAGDTPMKTTPGQPVNTGSTGSGGSGWEQSPNCMRVSPSEVDDDV